MDSELVPAAKYLRTSTNQQACSVETQTRAIHEYASRKRFRIVRTYTDIGRSGLHLSNRPGLFSLLQDVAYSNCDYKAILVYDVSRWGRFQDSDESAHYEFLCKAMSIPVHYCVEPFTSEINVQSCVLKNLKRAIAGEYSRELSARCFRGLKNLAERGFRVGGTCGYGLTRVAVSSDGRSRRFLRFGECKSLATDRVVLAHGPDGEVEVVKLIFSLALDQKAGCTAIANELNSRGIPYRDGRAWKPYMVDRIVKNPRYAGWNVWNRTSQRLGVNRKRNTSDEWIVVPNAFSPIVDPATFLRVQELYPKQHRWTKEQLTKRSKELASQPFAARTPGPSMTTLRRRLLHPVGLRTHRGTSGRLKDGVIDTRQRLLELRNSVFDELLELFPTSLSEFHLPGKSRPILKLNNGLIVSVLVCGRLARKTGILRWHCQAISSEASFVTLVCLDSTPEARYYVLPRMRIRGYRYIGTNSFVLKTGFRLNRLEEFYEAASIFADHDKVLNLANRSTI